MRGYEIARAEHPGLAVRRIAAEQASKALYEIRQRDAPVESRIHQLRKRCRRIRAVVRLVRSGLEAYRDANRRFRDIALRVSDHRDAQVMEELVGAICHPTGDDSVHSHPAERWYWTRCEFAREHGEAALRELEPILAEAAIGIPRWDVDAISIDDAIAGLRKTLGSAHACYVNAGYESPGGAFHQWRKDCRYHQLHLQLLGTILPTVAKDRLKVFDKLVALIGDEHDCSLLIGVLRSEPSYFNRRDDVRELIADAVKRRRACREFIFEAAYDAFDESVEDFCERVDVAWRTNRG